MSEKLKINWTGLEHRGLIAVKLRLLAGIALCVAVFTPAAAQVPSLKPGDTPLTQDELVGMAVGNTLVFRDDGRSRFSENGDYSYTYPDNGGTARGEYEIKDDGRICIEFANGFNRCDFYIRRDQTTLLLSESGYRFPFRVELGVKH